MAALCGANFAIGTALRGEELRRLTVGALSSCRQVMIMTMMMIMMMMLSSCRQLRCLSALFSLRPWIVGLACQTTALPFLAYALSMVVFTDGVGCNKSVALSRVGLFMLATSPGNTASIYFAR